MPSEHFVPQTSSLRLLVLSPLPSDTNAGDAVKSPPLFSPFLERITGASPAQDVETFAGYTSHPPLRLRTKYYSADVSIWCDEVPGTDADHDHESENSSDVPSLSTWQHQMTSSEAAEVRLVIGALVVLFSFSSSDAGKDDYSPIESWSKHLEALDSLRTQVEEDSGRDVASVVVLQDKSTNQTSSTTKAYGASSKVIEQLEEELLGNGLLGWDIVYWHPLQPQDDEGSSKETNDFGEKIGIARVIEVLEQVNWLASAGERTLDATDVDTGNSHPDHSGSNPSGIDFLDIQHQDFQRELMDMKTSMLDRQDLVLESSPLAKVSHLDSKGSITDLDNIFSLLGPGDGSNSKQSIDDGAWPDDEHNGTSELQVDGLPDLLERVISIKEAASEMNQADREKFARREVIKIMNELG